MRQRYQNALVCALLLSSSLAFKSCMLSHFAPPLWFESLATSTPKAKLAVLSKLVDTLRLAVSPITAWRETLSARRLNVGDLRVGVSG
jgi:hypothetical protein